jgi:hypothetical protein
MIHGADKQRSKLRSGATLKKLLAQRDGRNRVDLEPGCAYGVVTRQMVDDLTHELREIRGRINQLFSLTAGAIILDVLFRVTGLG